MFAGNDDALAVRGDLHLIHEAFGAKRVGLFDRRSISAFKNSRGDADRSGRKGSIARDTVVATHVTSTQRFAKTDAKLHVGEFASLSSQKGDFCRSAREVHT